MRVLLTDLGREWVNQLVDQLLKNAGVEHKTTSPFNPSVNGLCENFNGTLVETLRKLSETNPLNWPDKLKFALMAYRSRIHSTTKISPFELMFGRPMNGFGNW
jgi:transposase InsO family protein